MRWRILVEGVVQGVGFRPFVYRLAQETALSGFVCNQTDGVVIEVQGAERDLTAFRHLLSENAPAAALLKKVSCEELAELEAENSFVILPSRNIAAQLLQIVPDLAACPECIAEMQRIYDEEAEKLAGS